MRSQGDSTTSSTEGEVRWALRGYAGGLPKKQRLLDMEAADA